MSTAPSDFVPKVHPATRPVESEDPMELVATPAPGDPGVMLECIVQEFAGMGWDAAQLLALFRSPAYPVLNQLLAYYGEEAVSAKVRELLGRWGVFRVRETIADDPEPDADDEPELIQLTVRQSAGGRACERD
jgi:hypothetical protein